MVDVDKLSNKEFGVYMYLKYENDVKPSIKKISEFLGISKCTVSRAVAKLKKQKYLRIHRYGRFKYSWIWPDKKCQR